MNPPPFLSHLHTHLREARLTRKNATHRPEDVPKGLHKEYPRMPSIKLPDPISLPATLQDVLQKRHSAFSGNPNIPVTLAELGTLFGLSLRKRQGVINRNYPSGGALYPIETYLISTALESQDPGVFHYNPTEHSLERLWDLPAEFDIKEVARKPESLKLSNIIVFTSVWHRSSAKYGDLSYLHALIEAGHMSQNILLTSTALDLETRPYAGFNDTFLVKLLDLNDEEEQPIHTITLCKGTSTASPTFFDD